MFDLYLKFPSEDVAKEVLYTDDRPNFANIDVIGPIYTGGQWGVDGEVITEPVLLEGWHVNVRVVDEDASALEPYCVTPQAPVRVWA